METLQGAASRGCNKFGQGASAPTANKRIGVHCADG